MPSDGWISNKGETFDVVTGITSITRITKNTAYPFELYTTSIDSGAITNAMATRCITMVGYSAETASNRVGRLDKKQDLMGN
jgi:hypothetical protein